MISRHKAFATRIRFLGLTLCLPIAVLVTVQIKHLPATVIADNLIHEQLYALIQKADDAIGNKRWDLAKSILESAPDYPDDVSTQITDRLYWCRLHSDLSDRYADRSVAEFVRQTSDERALLFLEEVLQLIEQKYYTAHDRRNHLLDSLAQLLAATENPVTLAQYPVRPNPLEKLQQAIQSSYDRLADALEIDDHTVLDCARSLRQASQKSGFGSAWPAIELAYAYTDYLDSYSHVLSPSQYQAMQDRLKGFYVGIGIDIIPTDTLPRVYDVVQDSPADRAGLLPGDYLVKASGVDLKDIPMAKIGGLLGGARNSRVTIHLQRGDEQLDVTVQRDLIDAPSVRDIHMLEHGNRVGYIRVATFDRDTAMEVQRACDLLLRKNMKALLIDLRCNGGGIMASAIDATRLFIDTGNIVTVQSANKSKIYRAGGEGFNAYHFPVIILVDHNTASAAEIFTAALQDSGRATIIGSQTHGKGRVQTVYHLKNSTAGLCITTAAFVPPSQESFHRSGITPDIVIVQNEKSNQTNFTARDYLSNENQTLQKALQTLAGQKTTALAPNSSKNHL